MGFLSMHEDSLSGRRSDISMMKALKLVDFLELCLFDAEKLFTPL